MACAKSRTLREYPTASTLRGITLRALRSARNVRWHYTLRSHNTEPDDSAYVVLAQGAYVALWASYCPVALMTRHWISAGSDSRSQEMRREAYQAFVEACCTCWPAWPPSPYPIATYVPKLVGLGAVAVATMVWAEIVDQELLSGPQALRLVVDAISTGPHTIGADEWVLFLLSCAP